MSFFANTARRLRDFWNRDVNVPLMDDTRDGFLMPHELKSILDIDAAEEKRQRQILKARAFHEGDHGVQLTARLATFLGTDPEDAPCLNVARTVTMAVAEMLVVEKFESDAPAESERALQEQFAAQIVANSQFDAKQGEVWEEILRDGEGFLFVHWDAEANDGKGAIEWIPHPRYTDPSVSYEGIVGDGFGIRMFYPGHDTSRKPLFAVKRSTENDDAGKPVDYLTIYYPDRICKYFKQRSGWMPLYESTPEHPEGVWPLPRVDAKGRGLGISIVHFRTPFERPEAKDAFRLQRALNKIFLDFLVSGDTTAFRIWKYFGWEPTDEDGNPLPVEPGMWIGTAKKAPDEANFEAIDGPAQADQTSGIDKAIGWVAMTTDTPTTRFQMTGQIARAETRQEQDKPLKRKAKRRTLNLGLSCSAALRISRRLHNAYAIGGPKLNESAQFVTLWEAFDVPTIDEKKTESEAMKAVGFTDEEIREKVWGIAPTKAPTARN